MLRGFYIAITVLWLIFIIYSAFMIDEVHSAKWRYYDSYSYGGSYSNPYDYGDSYSELTFTAAVVSLFMFLICVTVEILTLVKLKSKTMKVLSIIGLSLTGIMLFIDGVMMTSPGGASFDEAGPVFVIFGIVQLAFSIVGIIHAFKFEGRAKQTLIDGF